MGSNIQTATTVEAPTEAHDPSGPRLTSCATGPVRSAALLSPCPATEPPFHRSPKSQILILAATLAAAVSQLLSGGLVAPAGRRLEPPAASGRRLQLPAASARPLGARRLRPRAQATSRSRLKHAQGPDFGRLPRAPSKHSRAGPQGTGLPCCTGLPRTCTRTQGRARSQPKE